MKISISKIIIFSFTIFLLLVFWQGLKKDNNYDTENLIGSRISSFQLIEINNNDQYISEEDLKKNKMLADYKVLFINASSFGISMTDIDIGLKIFLLLITIFYTLQKWWIMNKKK